LYSLNIIALHILSHYGPIFAGAENIQKLASEFDAGLHVHVAEDLADVEHSRSQHDCGLVERLERVGALTKNTLLAHCTHLTPDEMQAVGVPRPDNRMNSSQNTLKWLTDHLYEMKKDLEDAEQEFLSFKQKVQLISPEERRQKLFSYVVANSLTFP